MTCFGAMVVLQVLLKAFLNQNKTYLDLDPFIVISPENVRFYRQTYKDHECRQSFKDHEYRLRKGVVRT